MLFFSVFFSFCAKKYNNTKLINCKIIRELAGEIRILSEHALRSDIVAQEECFGLRKSELVMQWRISQHVDYAVTIFITLTKKFSGCLILLHCTTFFVIKTTNEESPEIQYFFLHNSVSYYEH